MDGSIAGLLVGRTLVGRYLVEEVIGRGGMSVVFRAVDGRLGRPVAVKVISLPPGTAEEHAELRERLRREAASAARISTHPNVVQVYDYGTDPELHVDFIAMELLRGRDLKAVLQSDPLPYGKALEILRDAARGVAAGHRAGIVHRDLKPGNIILVPDGATETVKILDFGIAKALQGDGTDDLTRTGFSPHSPAYASPEQLRPEQALSAASDVFQLGLIGYELLAGERAYGPDDQARMKAGEDPGVPVRGSWGEVPRDVREVIERALAHEPADRFPDADTFCQALTSGIDDTTAFLGDARTPTARPAAAPERPAGSAHPAAAFGTRLAALPRNLKLGALASVVLLGLWLALRPDAEQPSAADVSSLTPDLAALDQEFRELELAAHTNLARESSPAEGEAAARAVEEVIRQLTAAWVDGVIETHVESYADRVLFYGRAMDRESIARERAETLVRFPRRSISIERVSIRFPEPGRAQALIDKSWDFSGDDRRWEGAARQELVLELTDGRWLVTDEQDLEVYRSDIDD